MKRPMPVAAVRLQTKEPMSKTVNIGIERLTLPVRRVKPGFPGPHELHDECNDWEDHGHQGYDEAHNDQGEQHPEARASAASTIPGRAENAAN